LKKSLDQNKLQGNLMSLGELSRRRWQIAIVLSTVVVVIYFGFILLIAFDKELVATRIAPGLSFGILLGALVIISAWVTTWIYVRWANGSFDRRVRELRAADDSAGVSK
jgi:uncharacterized membrane protein (DUF485 family)